MENQNLTKAEEKLTSFLAEASKGDSPIPKGQQLMIKFALENESKEKIEEFVEWLFEGEEHPEKSALNDLISNKYGYSDHFGNSREPYAIEVKINGEDVDYEELACDTAQKEFSGWEEYGYCVYYSSGRWHVTTDFEHDDFSLGGNPNRNYGLFAIDFIQE